MRSKYPTCPARQDVHVNFPTCIGWKLSVGYWGFNVYRGCNDMKLGCGADVPVLALIVIVATIP